MTCDGYAQGNHRPGTKAYAGRCSWRQFCNSPTTFSVTVSYLETDRTATYALCNVDHRRAHEYFSVAHR